MTTEEKFSAAVKVIKNLPKNGSFQPSEELMLRFYSYYKQATQGPCKSPKPVFWQVVKKSRWEAWSKLGDTLTREDAMNRYVEELKGIIETMSYNENVADFLNKTDLNVSQDRRGSNASSIETFVCENDEKFDKSFLSSNYETCLEESSSGNNDADDEFIDSTDFMIEDSYLQKELFLKNHFINENQIFNKVDHDIESTNNDLSKYAKTNLLNFDQSYNSKQFMNQIMITLKELQENLDLIVNRIGVIEEKVQNNKNVKVDYDKSKTKS